MQSSTNGATSDPASVSRFTTSSWSLFDLLVVMGRYKLLVLGLPLLFGLGAFAASLLLHDEYRSTLVVAASDRTPATLVKNVAESDPVRNAVIERLKLAQRYGGDEGVNVAARYGKRVTAKVGREGGLLSISAVDEDPQFAAQLAETVARETVSAVHRELLSGTSLALRKLKVRQQQAEGEAAEGAVRLAKAGITDWRGSVSGSESGLLSILADLQADINLQAADPRARENSTMLLQLRLASFQQQLSSGAERSRLAPAVLEDVKDQFYLDAVRKRLDAQIELAQDDMLHEIKIAGPAPVPLVKDSPKRLQILVAGAAAGFALALAIVLSRERGEPTRRRALLQAWGRRPA